MKRKRQREPGTQGSKAGQERAGATLHCPLLLAKLCISHPEAMQAFVLSKRLHSLIWPRNQVLPFQAPVLEATMSSGLLAAGFNDSFSITEDQSNYLVPSSFVLSHVRGENITNICSRTSFYDTIFFISAAQMRGPSIHAQKTQCESPECRLSDY